MTAHQSAASPPDQRADRAPLHRGRRRPAARWIVHGVLFVALVAGVFGLLPRLGTVKGKARESRRRRRLADPFRALVSGERRTPEPETVADPAEPPIQR
jgi:hypothetical protein